LSLDVSERLDGARTRLGDAEGLTHEVILLAEQRRAFVDATRGIDWLKNRPFHTLLSTIVLFETSRICRLWDPANPMDQEHGFSIPTLTGLVDDPVVFSRLIDESADDLSDPERAPAVAENMRRFRAALDEAKLVEASDQLKRLRNFRHKHVAHATLLTAHERLHGDLDFPHKEDADWVVERTIAVMTEFSSLARGAPFNDHRRNQVAAKASVGRYFGVFGPALADASRTPL
jgi:hypothetical protein